MALTRQRRKADGAEPEVALLVQVHEVRRKHFLMLPTERLRGRKNSMRNAEKRSTLHRRKRSLGLRVSLGAANNAYGHRQHKHRLKACAGRQAPKMTQLQAK